MLGYHQKPTPFLVATGMCFYPEQKQMQSAVLKAQQGKLYCISIHDGLYGSVAMGVPFLFVHEDTHWKHNNKNILLYI